MLTGPGLRGLGGAYWSVDSEARLYLFGEGAPDDLDTIMSRINADFDSLVQQLQRMGSRAHIASAIVSPRVARSLWKNDHIWIQQFMFATEANECISVGGFVVGGNMLPLHIVRKTQEHNDFEFEVLNFPGEESGARLRGHPD